MMKKKKILLYGEIVDVWLGEEASNDTLVRMIRTLLKENEVFDIDFAIISDAEENTLSLLFLFDLDSEIIGGPDDAAGDFARLLTGDGRQGVKLQYPISGSDKPDYIPIEQFTELYRENCLYYGCDDIDSLRMFASETMLRINIIFKRYKNE